MNKKKIITIIIILFILSIAGGITYYFLTKQDNNTLTILEKQWIEENKNDVIDLGMVNGVPIFNYDGEGLLFDFIESLEEDTNLEFNKISYSVGGEIPANYSFMYVDTIEKNDILVYQDNYVIMTNESTKYNRLNDIPTMTLGVLDSDLSTVNYYLKENKNISYKSYETVSALIQELRKTDSSINGIVLPKTIYMEELSGTDAFHIAYSITEMNKNLVLRLGDNKRLNTIIKKYYKKWYQENYQKKFNNYLSTSYFDFNDIYEEEVANFRGKRYQYAFVSSAPYDALVDRKLVGINNEIMKDFAKVANLEINYKQYSSYKKLIEDFNANKIDFFMNTGTETKYSMDVVSTVSIFEEEGVIVSHNNHDITIHSLASLHGYTVLTIADSQIEKMLKEYDLTVQSYSNIKDLLNHMDKNSILAIDTQMYNTYIYNSLKNFKVDYRFSLTDSYHYVIRDIEENEVFSQYFNFYLSFINGKHYSNLIHHDLFVEKVRNTLEIVAVIVGGILVLIIGFFLLWRKSHKKPKKKTMTMSKEDKLKYIDMLTSLKNRNYLNDNIQKWDDSEIYPQAIIIVDLNNVAYINDNYGHEEGDNIIREAANILIKNQAPNSEIMRTNGNEFLIYMVETEEKQVISYIRKLSKEFKELAHGFGAAVGYSMIHDAIKTVDDAINEATLDMRNNKEEANN